jgi:hypothetical protein
LKRRKAPAQAVAGPAAESKVTEVPELSGSFRGNR